MHTLNEGHDGRGAELVWTTTWPSKDAANFRVRYPPRRGKSLRSSPLGLS